MIYRNTPERQAIADVLRGLLATRKLRNICVGLTQTGLDLSQMIEAQLQSTTKTSNLYCGAARLWHDTYTNLFGEWNGLRTWSRLDHPVFGPSWHGEDSEPRWELIEFLFKEFDYTPARELVKLLKSLKSHRNDLQGLCGLNAGIMGLTQDIEVFRLWRDTRDNSIQSWLTGPGAGTIGLANAQASEDWSDLNTDRWSMVEHLIEYYSTPTQGASS